MNTKSSPSESVLGNVPRRSALEHFLHLSGMSKKQARAIAKLLNKWDEETQFLRRDVERLSQENEAMRGQVQIPHVVEEQFIRRKADELIAAERAAYVASLRSYEQEIAEYLRQIERLTAAAGIAAHGDVRSPAAVCPEAAFNNQHFIEPLVGGDDELGKSQAGSPALPPWCPAK